MTDEVDRPIAPSLDGTMPAGWRERSSKPETHPRQRIVFMAITDPDSKRATTKHCCVAVITDGDQLRYEPVEVAIDPRMKTWRRTRVTFRDFCDEELGVLAEWTNWDRKRMFHALFPALPVSAQHVLRKEIGRFVHRYKPNDKAYTPPLRTPKRPLFEMVSTLLSTKTAQYYDHMIGRVLRRMERELERD